MLRLLLLSLVIYGKVYSHNVFRPSFSGNDNSGFINNSGDANSGDNSGTINYGANSGNENFGNHNGNNIYNHKGYSGNDNSGFINNSGDANSGENTGTINYGANSGNANFGNHNGNNVNVKENFGSYSGNDNSGIVINAGDANSGDNSGTISYGANNGNENFGNHNGNNVYNLSKHSGNDNSGFMSNSGNANSGINYGTINNGANNGNKNFANHNGDNVYNNNKDITNLGHHFGINYHGSNHATHNFGNHNGNNIFSNIHGIQNHGHHQGNNNFGNNFGNGNYGGYNWNKKTTTATTTIAPPTTSIIVPTTTSSPTTPTKSTTTTIITTTSTTGIDGTTIRHCTCNGAIDANDLGKCTKEDVWCYVDPESDCNDSEEWTGEFGFGWTYSYEACEAQLEMEYAGECNAVAEKAKLNQANNYKNECSCNGVVDTNNGGECLKPWVGNFWCYVDAESGCLDSQVWFGEFGFCETYSFQACGFTNTSSGIEFDTMDNTTTSTVTYEVATVLTPAMTILGDECSCSGVIDDDNLGECTKKTVWCYVHPDAPCNDTLVWSGQFGYGWTYSYQACEAQLALTHKDECQLPSQANQTDVIPSEDIEDGECSCNGDVDSNNGGECLKAWVGVLWCYVDLQSGCQDTKVWYGEFGFCQTYSFKACDGFNNKTVAAEEVLYKL